MRANKPRLETALQQDEGLGFHGQAIGSYHGVGTCRYVLFFGGGVLLRDAFVNGEAWCLNNVAWRELRCRGHRSDAATIEYEVEYILEKSI